MHDKFKKLQTDVDKKKIEYGKKRDEYDSKVRIYNIAISLLSPVSAFAIFLSFFVSSNAEVYIKVIGLISSILVVVLSYIARTENYGGKLLQRTKTYFSLCNLHRKIEYAEQNTEKYNEFVKEFFQIMDDDNNMSMANSQTLANIFQNSYINGIKQEKNLKISNQGENDNQRN